MEHFSVTPIYSNIRILGTEYLIFEYKYLIFWLRIYSIFIFRQIKENKYIRYSYSLIGLSIYYLIMSFYPTLPWTLCSPDLGQQHQVCIPSGRNKSEFVS